MAVHPFYDTPHGQISQFERRLAEAGLESQMIELVNKKPDIARLLVSELVKHLWTSRLVYERFTPIDQYASKIARRSQKCGWGLDDIDTLKLSLRRTRALNHAGKLAPSSVRIWRGKDLAYNLDESLSWLRDELRKYGSYDLCFFVSPGEFAFRPGSETTGEPHVTTIGLDFDAFSQTRAPQDVQGICPRWPGLELIDFLALNPHFCSLIGEATAPTLIGLGLKVGGKRAPALHIYRNGDQICIGTCSFAQKIAGSAVATLRS